MKKIILLSFILTASQISRAQVPNWLWAESSGGTAPYEYMCGLAVDTIANNFFLAGRFGGTNNLGGLPVTAGGSENPVLGRFNENGNAIWLSEYTFSTGFDYPYGFFRDSKDNTFCDGTVNSSQSAFVEKYNSAGVQQWEITPGANIFSLHGIAEDGKGCVYVAGWMQAGSVTLGSFTLNYSGSGQAVVVAKLDPTGNFLWAKNFYGTGNDDGANSGRGLIIDSHANIYIAGGYSGAPVFGSITAPLTTGISSLFILKMDSSGKVLSLVTSIGGGFPAGDCCSSNQMTIDSCDNIYVGGYFDGSAQFGDYVLNSYGGQDGFIAKCNHDGTWDWAQNFGGTGDDGIGAITLDKNTDVYVGCNYQNGAAQIEGTSISGGDMAVIKLDNGKGYVDWIQTCGNSAGGDGFGGVAVDNKGYVYLAGGYSSSATFGSITLGNGVSGTNFLAKLDTLNHISINDKPDSVYCAGKTYTLPFTISGTFSSGNIFTAQLSNSSGSFNPPVNIGSYTSTTGGTITITIPSSTSYGTHYRIRILSTKPSLITTIPTSSCIYRPIDTSYFYITIYPIPSLVITGNNSVCPGDTTTLSTYGADHYLWNTGDTTSSITVTPALTTTYSVKLTNGPCIYSDTTVVYINPLPVITVNPSTATVCYGKGLSLSASGALTYKWSPAAGLNAVTGVAVFASPANSTTYTVLGTDSNGCAGTTSVAVSVNPTPTITVNNPPPICIGSSSTLIASGGTTYFWSPSTGLSATTGSSVTAKPENTTIYTVLGTDTNGCTGKASVTVNLGGVQPTASFTAIVPNPCQPLQWQFTNISGDSTYLWRFGDGTTSNENNPSHTFSSTGAYDVTLVVISPQGCVDSITKNEIVNSIDIVLLPNAFTPRVAGVNQKFRPNILCNDIPNYLFRVYDRWGELMYESNNANDPGWDGKYNGKTQPMGTYVYYLKLTCETCTVFKKGNVTLIR